MKFKYNNSKNRFSFPAALTPDLDDGGHVVTLRKKSGASYSIRVTEQN